MTHTLKVSEATQITGGLSNPRKMPGKAWGLPAAGEACPIGSKLALVPNTVCSDCYACKGCYGWPVVKAAQERRLAGVKLALDSSLARGLWISAMVRLIGREAHFRWHDSGDLFSLEYLEMIVEVIRLTPETRHWIPTREGVTVRAWQRKHGSFPENVTVRLSAAKVDTPLVAVERMAQFYGLPVSTVTTGTPTCLAPQQQGQCKDCRACWDPTVTLVSYRKH